MSATGKNLIPVSSGREAMAGIVPGYRGAHGVTWLTRAFRERSAFAHNGMRVEVSRQTDDEIGVTGTSPGRPELERNATCRWGLAKRHRVSWPSQACCRVRPYSQKVRSSWVPTKTNIRGD